jgi:hypothetical protein
LDPRHFISSAEAAAGIASSPLSSLASAYPRLPPAMMALSGVPGVGAPYGSGEQNPYTSLSVENFYNPLVSLYIKFYHNTNFLLILEVYFIL